MEKLECTPVDGGAEKHNTIARQSNIELFRIFSMFFIVAHHYVVNSPLITCVSEDKTGGLKALFFLLFGAWEKLT